MFSNLLQHFEQNLQEAEKLIIIGYGCKDEKINELILNNFSSEKPLFMINPYQEGVIGDFKNSFGKNAIGYKIPMENLKPADF